MKSNQLFNSDLIFKKINLNCRKWTHYLNGEVKEGGRWHQEEYDYFSLISGKKEDWEMTEAAFDKLTVQGDKLLTLIAQNNNQQAEFTEEAQI